MRILDQNNIELNKSDIDYNKGYLIEENIFVQHHEAIEAVAEEGHWETIAEYPNAGKDVAWVVDVEAVKAEEAWDEYEDIYRYIPYTEEEIAEHKAAAEEAYKNSPEYRISELEAALELLLSGVTE